MAQAPQVKLLHLYLEGGPAPPMNTAANSGRRLSALTLAQEHLPSLIISSIGDRS